EKNQWNSPPSPSLPPPSPSRHCIAFRIPPPSPPPPSRPSPRLQHLVQYPSILQWWLWVFVADSGYGCFMWWFVVSMRDFKYIGGGRRSYAKGGRRSYYVDLVFNLADVMVRIPLTSSSHRPGGNEWCNHWAEWTNVSL
ncbi:hypothetical protein C5167_023420, partial [Papaver somniferum]